MTEVRLQGEVRSPQQGAIELLLMHTRAGEGLLETPLAIISTWTLEAPAPSTGPCWPATLAGAELVRMARRQRRRRALLARYTDRARKTIELSSLRFGYAIEFNLEPPRWADTDASEFTMKPSSSASSRRDQRMRDPCRSTYHTARRRITVGSLTFERRAFTQGICGLRSCAEALQANGEAS